MTASDQLAALREKYRIVEKTASWLLYCVNCKSAFELMKPSGVESVKAGNILQLLNHAASHDIRAVRKNH